MTKSAAVPARVPVSTEDSLARRQFLENVARHQPKQFSAPKGFTQADALFQVFEKAGVSREELAQIQAKTSEHTRAVGKSFIESLKERNLNGMTAFENAAHLTNDIDYPGKGRPIQLKSIGVHTWNPVLFDGPVPPPQYYPPNAVYQDCHIHGEGVGSGIDWPWVTDTGERGGTCWVEYKFSFIPSVPKQYALSSSVIFGGLYSLVADDGALDSKEAQCDVSSFMTVQQILPAPVPVLSGRTVDKVAASTASISLFDIDSQNILDGGVCSGGTTHELTLLLFSGIEADVSVMVSVDAWARGDGSMVDLNLANPVGAVGCAGLFVS